MTTPEPTRGHNSQTHSDDHSPEPTRGHNAEPTHVGTGGPKVIDMATPGAWAFAAVCSAAGVATTWILSLVPIVSAGLWALVLGLGLLATVAYGVAWTVRGRTDGR